MDQSLANDPGLEHRDNFSELLRRAILVPLLLPVGFGAFVVFLVLNQLALVKWVDHTDQVIIRGKQAETDFLDARSGFRTFGLTSDESYLSKMKASLAGAKSGITELLTMTEDNFEQATLLHEIERLLGHWASSVANWKQKRILSSSKNWISTFENHSEVDKIRDKFSLFVDRELKLRESRTEESQRGTRFVLLSAFSVAVMIGIFLSQHTRSKFRRLTENYEAALKRAHEAAEAKEYLLKELERSNTDLAQFASVASHDLKEPLRMVSLYVGLVAERFAKKGDEAAEFMGYAVEGAARMRKLIDSLLNYSQIGTHKTFESVDTNQILDETVASFTATIVETQSIVERGELPTILGNPVLLGQLFQNLIGNAIKFRKPTEIPRIFVSCERTGERFTFRVRDNGIGVDPQFAVVIFNIFQRLHSRREFEGTGIGLAVCKRVVELHGGKIWAEANPTGGATFCFTLPNTPSNIGARS